MHPETITRIEALYPALASLPAPLREVLARTPVVPLAPGTVLFEEGSACEGFPLVLDGSIKVLKAAPNGRELPLYRVGPGESCVLTSGCLLGQVPYRARGFAETATTLVAVPRPLFLRLVAESEPFWLHVFALFAERLADLMSLVESVAFQRLDQRLAALLLGHGKVIHTTHQQLADELGSVREIVTRLLRGFADQGYVALSRERIEILDAAALRALAQ